MTHYTARQTEAIRMHAIATQLVNPHDGRGCTSDPRWHAFEGFRENLADSLEGEFDDAISRGIPYLQQYAEESAIDNASDYAEELGL